MKIAVIGLGKMGLPFAVNCATTSKISDVVGCDVDSRLVDSINSGICPIDGEIMLAEGLSEALSQGNFRATTETEEAIKVSDVIVVLVPVYVDKLGSPLFEAIDNVTAQIAKSIKPGTLVSYETTLPVGTTRTRFAQTIGEISTLEPDKDFFVCFSPERVSSGSVLQDLRNYPKLVGGIGPVSEERGAEFYRQVISFSNRPDLSMSNGVWRLGTAEAAELAKLAETTYRDVNIGLANQFAIYASKIGVNISKVIEACNSQPYSHIHTPGIAVGGHCIPVYPKMYLLNDPDATIVSEGRKQNEMMPSIYVSKLIEFFGGSLEGQVVVILGLAYRTGVREDAFSGAYAIHAALTKAGATVLLHDYLFDEDEIQNRGFKPYIYGMAADAVVLHTPDKRYESELSHAVPSLKVILDGRAFFKNSPNANVELINL